MQPVITDLDIWWEDRVCVRECQRADSVVGGAADRVDRASFAQPALGAHAVARRAYARRCERGWAARGLRARWRVVTAAGPHPLARADLPPWWAMLFWWQGGEERDGDEKGGKVTEVSYSKLEARFLSMRWPRFPDDSEMDSNKADGDEASEIVTEVEDCCCTTIVFSASRLACSIA